MAVIEEQLVKELLSKGLKISTAESCTGGLLSEMITRVSGASEVFECGVCSYSNEIKIKVLDVKTETIDKFTEVSIPCAEEMAQGVQRISGADIGISTTGIAGPTGGTKENPVGTVYMGFATKDGVFAEKKNFNEDNCGNRIEIRKRCANYCLKKIYSLITGKETAD